MTTRPRAWRALAAVVVCLVLLSGCSMSDSGSADEPGAAALAAEAAEQRSSVDSADADPADGANGADLDGADRDRADVPAADVGAADVEAAGDAQIVVETQRGEIYLVDAGGGGRIDLAGSQNAAARHPVWSPDGKRIAWSEITASGFAIASTDSEGAQKRRAVSIFSGYFGYWDPTSTRLGFLGNFESGTGLIIDDGSGTDLTSVADNDTFYYYSWSPDGSRWAVHSGSGMRIVSLDGTATPIEVEPGRFRAPVWAPDDSILIATPGPDGNTIVRLDPDTGETTPVLMVGDITSMVLDPTGRYLAIESVHVDLPDSPEAEPELDRAEVLVHDLATGETTIAWTDVTAGFWWSPDGSRLAVLVADDERANSARWFVWSAEESFTTDAFRPTPNFAQGYIPFFDQFAQAVNLWAPDSSQFVYAGIDTEGQLGVFVQRAEAGTAPERIADDGVVAFWSPA